MLAGATSTNVHIPIPSTYATIITVHRTVWYEKNGRVIPREGSATPTTSLRPALTTSLCRAVHSGFHLEVRLLLATTWHQPRTSWKVAVGLLFLFAAPLQGPSL